MTSTKRTRLSPEDRRQQLLDTTQAMILELGLNAFTMEALAKRAAVSNPLVYKYFDTRLELLQALLVRENATFHENISQALDKAANYKQIVYTMVSVNFDQLRDGNVLQVLRNQPDIDMVLRDEEKKKSRKLAQFLVNALMKEYPLDQSTAEMVTRMASAASISAAEHYSRYGGDRESMIDDTVRFIFGGLGEFVVNG